MVAVAPLSWHTLQHMLGSSMLVTQANLVHRGVSYIYILSLLLGFLFSKLLQAFKKKIRINIFTLA